MKLNEKAREKLTDVFIRLGETAIIAGVGSLFLAQATIAYALGGMALGFFLVAYGIYFINKS